VPPKKAPNPKRDWGWEPLEESRAPSLPCYGSPAALISQERKQGPVPGGTLPTVEAAEFGKPNPTASLPLSAKTDPPHPPVRVLGSVRRQLC